MVRRILNAIFLLIINYVSFYNFAYRFPGRSCYDFRWFCISNDISEKVRIQCVWLQLTGGRINHSVGIFGERMLQSGRRSNTVIQCTKYIRFDGGAGGDEEMIGTAQQWRVYSLNFRFINVPHWHVD